jgi:peptide deformylase
VILLDNDLSKDIAEYVDFDESFDIIKQLEYELQHSSIPGIGLASSQIGINKAVAIVRIPNPYYNTMISINLVNPKLIAGDGLIQFEEGCLSFPSRSAKTIRYSEIIIENGINDYELYADTLNSQRYKRTTEDVCISNNKRKLLFGEVESDPIELRRIQQLVCVCVQHEYAHLLGKNFLDFAPEKIERNDVCPCGSGIKNKKCHSYEFYNSNLLKMFNPKYKNE